MTSSLWLLCLSFNIYTVYAASPTFVTPPSRGGSGSIPENTAVGSLIIILNATDTDGDILAFAVASQTPALPVFTVNGNNKLITPSGLDYETVTSFTLTFSVTDGTNAVTTTYTLTITDVDDESPVFSPNTYTATILYSASAGTVMVTVTATDADSGSFTYSIQGAQTTFAISAAGVITVSDPSGLSSIGARVTLNINANDGTNAVGFATVSIYIQGNPCNSAPCQNGGTCVSVDAYIYKCTCLSLYTGTRCEHVENASPTFYMPTSDGSGSRSVAENAPVGSSIITLQATDADGHTLTFSVASQTPATPAFSINPATDNLEVPSGLDYETAPAFTLTLSVTDGTHMVTTTFTMTITDVDDESPVFSPNTYTATILNSALAGTVMVTVTATDADSSSFTYSIQGAQTTFAISAAGVITVSDPRFLSSLGASVTLNIQANDGTNAVGTATVTLIIQDSPCNSAPCQNAGTCVTTGTTTYSCTCLSLYTGNNCMNDNPCNSAPCQNEGTCVSVDASIYNCTCLAQYTGRVCEHDSPCNSAPCQNAGTCVTTSTTTYSCTCLSLYTGNNCENESSDQPSVAIIILSTITGVAVTAVVIMAILLLRSGYCKRRETSDKCTTNTSHSSPATEISSYTHLAFRPEDQQLYDLPGPSGVDVPRP